MGLFLGIDVGTTVCTSVVMDETGRIIDSQSQPITAHFPAPGRVEQDPEALISAVVTTAGALARKHAVSAAGIDNQGESFVLWDARTGKALTPNIVWQDQRGADVCKELSTRIDAAWLRARTGLLLDTYFSAPKLAQVLREDPALRGDHVRFGTTETWILSRLGSSVVTDPSTASRTLLFNLGTLRWDDELCALFGIPRGMLPAVTPSAGALGELRLPGVKPVPLCALLADQQAALFGQACLKPGMAKCTLGTGAFVLMNVGDAPRPSSHGLLTTVAWQAEGKASYALDGGVFAAGAAVQWLHEALKILPDVRASDGLARKATDDDVVVVPALCGLGAPRWLSDARGAMFGLSRGSTDADVTRATLRGIACQIRDVLEAMRKDSGQALETLRVDGGPTHNAALMQLLSDILGIPVQVGQESEATARGIAMLAASGSGAVPVTSWETRWKASRTYEPGMPEAVRAGILARWEKALAALRVFHAP